MADGKQTFSWEINFKGGTAKIVKWEIKQEENTKWKVIPSR